MNLLHILKNTGSLLQKNSPTVLSALAIGGVVTTAIFASKATLKAHEVYAYSAIGVRIDGEEDVPLSREEKIDIVKATWKLYIPALAVGALTIACVIGANTVHLRRTAALAGAYSLAERGLREFQQATHNQVGDKTMTKIREEVAQKRVDDDPVVENQIIVTDGGETLCRDALSGRYFKSSVERIRKAENNLNHRLVNGVWISVNDLYAELGLDHVKMGDDLGWVPDNLIEFRLDTALAEGKTPCIVMDYVVDPRTDPYRSI